MESTSEPWYRLYYDLLVRSLSFPALAPGDVLEVAWRVDDTASENLLSDYFGDLTFLDEPWRKLRFDYVLLAPESRAIHANQPAGVERAVRTAPRGRGEHRYVAARPPAPRGRARHARAGARWPATSTSPPTRPGTR